MQYRVTADNLAPNGTDVWIAIKARQRCGNSASVKPHIAGKVQQPVGGRRPERNVVGRHKPDIVPELQQGRADDVAFHLPHIVYGAWINQYQFDSARGDFAQRGDRLQRQGRSFRKTRITLHTGGPVTVKSIGRRRTAAVSLGPAP